MFGIEHKQLIVLVYVLLTWGLNSLEDRMAIKKINGGERNFKKAHTHKNTQATIINAQSCL